jgi:hypothetical protein
MPTTDTLPDEQLDFLGLARRRFKRASEAEGPQRRAILAAKEFRAGNQWPDEVRIQRMGGQAIQGTAAQPARPCLTIDRISAPVRQVSNTVRAANFAIDVHPNGFGADDETARILKGLLRQIQNDARGEDPIEWAADSAAEGGLGWFRLYADYCYNDLDTPPEAILDQDLKLGRISNCLTVYCDPSAMSPTKRDARYMFVVEDMAKSEFIRQYGEAKVPASDEYRSEGDDDAWIGDDLVRIAEYWTLDYDKVKVWVSPDGVVTRGPQPEGYDKETWRTRTLQTPKVSCAKITATEKLKSWKWPGTRIPLFPVLGEELNVDGKTVLRGVVAPAMDSQRMVNYLYSGAVESSGLMMKPKWIVAAGQVENYKLIWANANTTNFSYLPYDPISNAGTAVPPPQILQAEPAIQAQVELLHISEEAIKATTSIYDPSLGNTNPREKSGRAIMALQQQAEHANSNYVDNVQRAMVDCGNELVRLCPIFYDRPGRVIKIAGIDDSPEQVALGPAPEPPAGQPGPPQQAGAPPAQPSVQAQGMAQFYDLGKGNYSVTVGVSKSYNTKRQEGSAMLGEMISANPQLLQMFGDLYFRDLDTPGAQELSDRAKKMLPPQLQQDKAGQPDVNQLQGQLQQAGQMVENLSKLLDDRNEIIKTEQVKAQASLQEKQMDTDTRIKIAWIQASAQLAAAGMKVDAENARSFVDAIEAKGAAALEAHMQQLTQAKDHIHEAALTAMQQAHERATLGAQATIDSQAQQADQQHEAGLQADQQAAQADQQAAQMGHEQQMAQQQPTGE